MRGDWGLRPCVVLLDMQMAVMTAGYWKDRDLGDYAARISKPIQVPELKATLAKYC